MRMRTPTGTGIMAVARPVSSVTAPAASSVTAAGTWVPGQVSASRRSSAPVAHAHDLEAR